MAFSHPKTGNVGIAMPRSDCVTIITCSFLEHDGKSRLLRAQRWFARGVDIEECAVPRRRRSKEQRGH